GGVVRSRLRVVEGELDVAGDVEVVEERALLWHEAKLGAAHLELAHLHLEAVGGEGFGLEEHPREGGLARSRAAEEHDHLADPDVERHVVEQHRPVRQHHFQLPDQQLRTSRAAGDSKHAGRGYSTYRGVSDYVKPDVHTWR